MPPRKMVKKAAAAKKATAKKKAAPKKSVPKKASIKKTASKKAAAPRKAAAQPNKKAATKKAAAPRKKAVAKKAASAHKKATPKKAVRAVKAKVKPARSSSSSGSNASQEDILRKMLLKKKDELLGETRLELAKYRGEGENRQLVETALDDGDWSVIEHTDGLNLRKLGSYRDTIRKIDESIRKIDEKTYGVCEDCGEQINPERLKVLPFAICCRDCQEIREEQEAAEREESQYL